MGRGDVEQDLSERKKALEKELHEVEQKLIQQQREADLGGEPEAGKKSKKEKKVKEKKEKKAKAPKAHPSSKAGPGFSVALVGDQVVVANVNKKAHAYRSCGLREGDVILRIDEQEINDWKLNDVKAKLVAKCGTVLHIDLDRPADASSKAARARTFEEWLASVRDSQQTIYVGPYSADVILEFGPLVKTIKSGKPAQRGYSAELSLSMADSQVKRELFFLSGALQPLCKLLTDPKAAAQVDSGIKALENMLRVSMWEELSIAVSAMGKPLVQMIEKGGLSKKMLAIDVLLRIALFAPSHRVLVASGLVEALLAPPKGIIPLALPKYTPKGWKAGKKATGLEAKAATLVGSLARVDDSTRVRINSSSNNGVDVLVRMMQRKDEAAGALNHITPEGAARALEALQFVALNESCAAAAASKSGALESVVGIVAACNGAPASSRASKEELIEDIKLSFAKYDFAGRGTLNAKEFDKWGYGDSRQAKAAFREVDRDSSGLADLDEIIHYTTKDKPEDLADLYSAYLMRNMAVSAPLSERLHECGATGELVKMLGLAVEQRAASIDHRRSLAATLALFNMSSLPACAEQMAASKTEALLSTVMRATYTRARAQRPPALNAGEAQGPADTADAIETPVAPELSVAGNCSEAGCGAAFLLRQLVCKRECQARLLSAERELLEGRGDDASGSMMDCLCSMMRDEAVCPGLDPVGNDIACHAATAAVGVLQNLLAENEAFCRLALKCGAVECLKGVVQRWIDRTQRTNPPELPSEGEDSSDGEDEGGEDDEGSLAQRDGEKEEKNSAAWRHVPRAGSLGSEVGEALVLALSARGRDEAQRGEGGAVFAVDDVQGDSGSLEDAEGGEAEQEADTQSQGDGGQRFQPPAAEVPWTAQWWQTQRALDACRAAWSLRALAFRERALILEEDVAPLLRRALRVSTDEDTDTACTWALLALE